MCEEESESVARHAQWERIGGAVKGECGANGGQRAAAASGGQAHSQWRVHARCTTIGCHFRP